MGSGVLVVTALYLASFFLPVVAQGGNIPLSGWEAFGVLINRRPLVQSPASLVSTCANIAFVVALVDFLRFGYFWAAAPGLCTLLGAVLWGAEVGFDKLQLGYWSWLLSMALLLLLGIARTVLGGRPVLERTGGEPGWSLLEAVLWAALSAVVAAVGYAVGMVLGNQFSRPVASAFNQVVFLGWFGTPMEELFGPTVGFLAWGSCCGMFVGMVVSLLRRNRKPLVLIAAGAVLGGLGASVYFPILGAAPDNPILGLWPGVAACVGAAVYLLRRRARNAGAGTIEAAPQLEHEARNTGIRDEP